VLDPLRVPPVDQDEVLARFILSSVHLSKSNHTAKPEAFMPHPYVELSLTRHREAAVDELWNEGRRIASLRTRTLYGRADVTAAAFIDQDLKIEPRPIPENPNHADAIDWPAEKPAQKIKALEIEAKSQFVPAPT
jgi:hypothetical protein